MANKSDTIHADATYKLIWEGNPVLMCGITDMDKKFHPTGLAICSNERSADFEFIFNAAKSGIDDELNIDYKADALVADGADAITNGFKNVYQHPTARIMCYAHVIRAVEQRLKNNKFKDDIKRDFEFIHYAHTDAMFSTAVKLFTEKWEKVESFKDLDYLISTWFTQHPGWYLGIKRLCPTTNNALESTNNVIKKENTFREKLPMKEMLHVANKLVMNWSRSRDNTKDHAIKFSREPTIELSDWTSAYQWAKQQSSNLLHSGDYFYTLSCTESRDITKDDVRKFLSFETKLNWSSFDEYKREAFKVYRIYFSQYNWKDSECNCIDFFKNYKCKHVLGMAIRLKKVEVPPAAKNVPLGHKRKRGRPSKASKALCK